MRRVVHSVPRAAAVLFAAGLLISAFVIRYNINVPGFIAALAGAREPASQHGEYSPAVIRNIVYKTAGGWKLSLDLYPPEKRYFTKTPAVFLIGGSLDSGGKPDLAADEWAKLVLDCGLALVNIGYRPADGDAVFPAQPEDCGDAVRFMARHADEYGLDKNRFCIMGVGDGGYLALFTALTGGRYASDEMRAEPFNVRCTVNLCGATDLADFKGMSDKTRETAERLYRSYIGGPADDLQALYRQASPLYQIHTGAPPVFLAYCSGESSVPLSQVQRFFESAREKGLDITLVKGEAKAHNFAGGDDLLPASKELAEALKRFLTEKLVFSD